MIGKRQTSGHSLIWACGDCFRASCPNPSQINEKHEVHCKQVSCLYNILIFRFKTTFMPQEKTGQLHPSWHAARVGRTRLQCAVFEYPHSFHSADCFASPHYIKAKHPTSQRSTSGFLSLHKFTAHSSLVLRLLDNQQNVHTMY